MTFDEWYETAVFPNADDSVTARAAWSHQQAEIERLREDIRCLTKADIVRVPTKDSQQARIAELETELAQVSGYLETMTERCVTETQRNAELEQQLAELREAFDRLISVAEQCDGWEFFPSEELDAAISALKEQTP